jgi:ATP-dependent RNA helicase DDX10/DBP4
MRIATSRKELAKRSGKGTRLKFDDDGVAHPVYDLVSEAEFLAQGSPEEMKRKFVEETAKKMQRVDEGDREEARKKTRLKKLKRGGIVEPEINLES